MAMSYDKINEALDNLSARIRSHETEPLPLRLSEDDRRADISDLAPSIVLNHLLFMCEEAKHLLNSSPDKREKVMRWLGFVQGSCWCLGLITLEDGKDMNRPDVACASLSLVEEIPQMGLSVEKL